MRAYGKMIVLNLKSQMQYRFSFWLTVTGQLITAFTACFGLYFIFSWVDAVGGFSYEQVFLCYAVVMAAFSSGELLGGGFAVFPRIMGNGEFDRVLVRPRSVLWQIVTQHMDFTRIGLLIQAVIVLGYVIPRSGIAWNGAKIAALCLMILGGSILFFSLFLLKAAVCFFTVEGLEFMNLFTYGAREYGKYPFGIYGDGILKILTFVIPLALFQYYPMLYLFDRERHWIYMAAPLGSCLFFLPCYAFYRVGLKRYHSTGS